MKADIDSQFGYCPLKWVIHSGTMNKKNLNSIRERTLRMVYQDDTSTFDELLNRDNFVKILHKIYRF